MPKCQMRHKAGMFAFLLVCLLWVPACGKETVVFETDQIPVEAEELEKEEAAAAEPEAETKEETKTQEAPQSAAAENAAGLVNINTADAQTLMTLPGIGETRAAAILTYREQMGAFGSIEDIMNVKGIKSGVFSKISKLICVK